MPWIEAVAAGGAAGALIREPGADPGEVGAAVERAVALGLAAAVHERCPGGIAVAAALGVPVHLRGGAEPGGGPFAASTHTADEVDRALSAGAVYVTLSPVWPPASKPDDARPTLGPDAFLAIARDRPVLALGGVTPARFAALLARGGFGAAALGPLCGDPRDVTRAVASYCRLSPGSSLSGSNTNSAS